MAVCSRRDSLPRLGRQHPLCVEIVGVVGAALLLVVRSTYIVEEEIKGRSKKRRKGNRDANFMKD